MSERGLTSVLVVGAGRFGTHYLKILAGLNLERIPGVPKIDTIVLTRTRSDTAQKTALHLSSDPACAVHRVVGLRVADKTDLAGALQQHRPSLTCIVASDPTIGDAVHATYSEIAADFGPVLCEKPFSPSSGDGHSLAPLYRMRNRFSTDRFGLELPMVPVRHRLEKDLEWSRRIRSSRQISFLWATQTEIGRSNLIDTLALHPWSLIPPGFLVQSLRAEISPEKVHISGILDHREEKNRCRFSILLQVGNRTRAVGFDDRFFVFHTKGARVSVSEHSGPLPEDPEAFSSTGGRPLLEIDNPLKANIVASLQGHPFTGLSEAIASQKFLEMAKGGIGGPFLFCICA